MPEIDVGDAKVSYPAFYNVIKKYTDPLEFHECFNEDARAHIISISNFVIDAQVVLGFTRTMQENTPDLHKLIFETIPDTAEGEEFSQHFFQVSRAELLSNPPSILAEYIRGCLHFT